jgi:hypothetical protein
MLAQGQASLNEIIQHLHEGYDILYLLAHGRTDDAGETWLYLESADGRTVPVQGSALVTRIAELRKRPQLIVLGSCESAGALLALGLRLAQAGVPAVLGMQGRITLETLHTFLPSTLRALQRDGLIDQAVAIGRGVVRERPDFWAPVLFLRSRSGLLWLPSGAELETSEELLERMSTDEVPDEIAHKPTNNQVSIQISGEINVHGSDNSVYYNHSQHRLESVVVVTLQDTMAPINFNSVTEALAPDKPFGTPIFIRPIVGNLPWEAAAEHQHQVITEIIQRIRDLKISHFAVFSFAQIPLAIHLGFLLSDRIEVRCFQYDRERFSWSWPNIDPELADTNIQVTGIPTQFIEEETYVVIRVSLSARINPYDTNNVVGDSMLTIDIFVDNPDVMWLRHPSQLDHLAQVFRRTLASVRANVVHCSRIHLFYAGPTGGAVVIGQQINPRMNPPVELYHFSFQMTPRYQWVLTLTEAIS